VFTAGKPKPTGANKKDLAATPVIASLGLPSRELEPQIPQLPPLEPGVAAETGMVHRSPVLLSPSISIATLSDFAIADASDDEFPVDTMVREVSDDGHSIDGPKIAAPHETFYLHDGDVEVLCEKTLFRVHTTILSFQSPVLRRIFARTSLDTAESPNGCPRILSSDTATDFATLLKTIYLPG
jgi:hypothetical protein